MMRRHLFFFSIVAAFSSAVPAQIPSNADTAAAFGAREAIFGAALSPDGTKIAFLGPAPGSAVTLYSMDTLKETRPHVVLKSSGDPEHLLGCVWVANDRLTCQVGGYQ